MERRRYQRFSVLFPVRYTFDVLGQEAIGVGIASNLSMEGCAVEGNMIGQAGWNPELRMLLPDHASPLKVERGAVRWSQGRRFGAQFLRMGDEEQARMRRFVGTLETGPSR